MPLVIFSIDMVEVQWAGVYPISLWSGMLGGMGWRIVACPVVGVADGGALAEDCGLHWWSGTCPFISRNPFVPIFPLPIVSPYFLYPFFPYTSHNPPPQHSGACGSLLGAAVLCSHPWVGH